MCEVCGEAADDCRCTRAADLKSMLSGLYADSPRPTAPTLEPTPEVVEAPRPLLWPAPEEQIVRPAPREQPVETPADAAPPEYRPVPRRDTGLHADP